MTAIANRRWYGRAFSLLLATALAFGAGGAAAKPLAVLNGTWSWPSVTTLTDVVNAVAQDGSGGVYVGGNFTDGGSDTDCDYICYWSGSAWSWPAGQGLSSYVEFMALDGFGGLYVGGDFTNGGSGGGDDNCDYICLWTESTDTWSALGTGLTSQTNVIELDGSGGLYAGGYFDDGGGDGDCDRICYWSGSAWSWPSGMGLVPGSNPEAMEFDGAGNLLYVGGSMVDGGDLAGGNDDDCDYICLWDETADTWSWPSGMGLNSTVEAFGMDSLGNLYVGGWFSDGAGGAGDGDCDNICYWNKAADSFTWPAGMGLGSYVKDLELDPAGHLFAGGGFGGAGGDADADRVAYWNGSGWEWPTGGGLNADVIRLALDGGNLYAGGSFTNAGGDSDADYIAKMLPHLFMDSFESGDFSAWTSYNTGSGDMTVGGACAMVGSYGLCLPSTNDKRKQMIDSTPDDDRRYYGSFWLDTNGFDLSGAADRIRIFQGRMDAQFPFIVLLRDNAGTYQIRLRVQTDAGPGNYVDTAWWTITDAPHRIQVDWKAATGVGTDDGWGILWIDDVLQESIFGVDNDTLTIRGIRLGITTRMVGITLTGMLYMDHFYSDPNGYP